MLRFCENLISQIKRIKNIRENKTSRMGIMRFFAFIEFCKKSRNQKILISRNFTPLEYHVLEYIPLNNILLYADV